MIFVYLFACRNIQVLAHLQFSFIEVNLKFANGEGKRAKFYFPP